MRNEGTSLYEEESPGILHTKNQFNQKESCVNLREAEFSVLDYALEGDEISESVM